MLFFRDAAFTVRKSSIPRPAASRLTKIRLLRRFVYLLLPGVGRRRRSIVRVVASSDARALDVAPRYLATRSTPIAEHWKRRCRRAFDRWRTQR